MPKSAPLLQLALIGDSDIDRWPSELYPQVSNGAIVSGHSGATLADVQPHLETLLDKCSEERYRLSSRRAVNYHDPSISVFIACAGENDVGKGIALEDTVRAFERFLDTIFRNDDDSERHLIFLGPKFEPWMEDDTNPSIYKKQYSKLSRSLHRACQRHGQASCIQFIDCLTMFCTKETSHVAGAILGGRAKADYKYFVSDKLHLSPHGYQIWKEIVEDKIGVYPKTTLMEQKNH